jgi:hypothetical protein
MSIAMGQAGARIAHGEGKPDGISKPNRAGQAVQVMTPRGAEPPRTLPPKK